MKQITSNQLDMVVGGFGETCGSGNNNCGTSGGSNTGGNNNSKGGNGFQKDLSTSAPYGSGSGAYGFWGDKSADGSRSNSNTGRNGSPGTTR